VSGILFLGAEFFDLKARAQTSVSLGSPWRSITPRSAERKLIRNWRWSGRSDTRSGLPLFWRPRSWFSVPAVSARKTRGEMENENAAS